MKIVQTSDYRIYFDDVRVDPYIKTWSAGCGLTPSDAVASLTMYRTKALEEWKGYLTQVRIFALNVFNGKYTIVFEGEITNRSWNEARIDTGQITFNCKGFYHWLNTPIPMLIDTQEQLDYIQRFKYEAQNIDVEGVQNVFTTRSEMIMKDKPIRAIIDTLFDMLYEGYSVDENTAFEWTDLKGRIKVMGDVVKEFRDAGYLDAITFVRTSQIESFYVYLNQILTQLMFEFYQDRDGSLRIKPPSWADDILKAHIIDESVVQSASGFNDWENEPTRVLVIGGKQDIGTKGTPAAGASNVFQVPMGLYIGKPGTGEYFSQNVQVEAMFGTDTGDSLQGNGGSAKAANYYLTDFRISTHFSSTGIDDGWHSNGHNGVDFAGLTSGAAMGKTAYSLTDGEVITVYINNQSAGNGVEIKDGSGRIWRYLHFRDTPSVSKGDMVTQGQTIGIIGNTGRSSGAHLHVGLKNPSGSYIDPLPIIKAFSEQTDDSGTGYDAGGTVNTNPYSPDALWKGKYSVQINAAAQKYNVETYLIAAIIKQESNFNPNAGSSAGARGLMQLMPSTAQSLGVLNITNPHQNVDGGTKYIRQQLDSFKNLDHALAAYNAGPGNVKKYNGIPPFKETQNYVKKVKGYLVDFRGGKTDSGSSGESSGTPLANQGVNAMLGGTTFRTSYSDSYSVKQKKASQSKKGIDVKKNTPIGNYGPLNPMDPALGLLTGNTAKNNVNLPQKYPSGQDRYPIPNIGLTSYIKSNPNGVDSDLLACIIEVASNWSEKAEKNNHVGFMGIPSAYYQTQPNVTKAMLLDGQTNIMHGTTLFKNGFDRFSNKVTFALASLYTGNMTIVEAAIKSAGTENFSKAKLHMDSDVQNFVTDVIEMYTDLYGTDYIEGDPHYPITKDGTLTGEIDNSVINSPGVKDYESSYKPIMSDEEKLYKVNLKMVEQLLIRYDVEQNSEQIYNADELVERYARYIMQLFRAESHGINVSLSTCMPFLRPGFNAWFEPNRRDLVFYVTKINHQGSYGSGAFTTVSGGFVRDPNSYDAIEKNIFVSNTEVKAADFGETINSSKMNDIRTELKALHNKTDEIVVDAKKVPTLSKMYASTTAIQNDYSTRWTKDLTSNEIATSIADLYKNAPGVINDRKKKWKQIINDSAEFFTKMLNKTKR